MATDARTLLADLDALVASHLPVYEATLAQTIPGHHASTVAPVAAPTLRTGMSAMTVALVAYLAKGA